MTRRLMIGMALVLLAGCGGVETSYVQQQPWGGWARVECRRSGDPTRFYDRQSHCRMQPVSATEAESYR
jgi:hypothetical protein